MKTKRYLSFPRNKRSELNNSALFISIRVPNSNCNLHLRFAQLLGSGSAKRRWASATVAPIVSSVNVRITDILRIEKKTRK